jgi:ribosome maturation factor RimP
MNTKEINKQELKELLQKILLKKLTVKITTNDETEYIGEILEVKPLKVVIKISNYEKRIYVEETILYSKISKVETSNYTYFHLDCK